MFHLGTIVLALGMTACATTPTVVPLRVPAELAQEVEVPVLPETPNNGQLAAWADEVLAALREANRRLRKIGEL